MIQYRLCIRITLYTHWLSGYCIHTIQYVFILNKYIDNMIYTIWYEYIDSLDSVPRAVVCVCVCVISTCILSAYVMLSAFTQPILNDLHSQSLHWMIWIHWPSRDCTGWQRLIGSPKLQIIFHKRAIKYRSLLRKMTCKDKGSISLRHPVPRAVVCALIQRLAYTHSFWLRALRKFSSHTCDMYDDVYVWTLWCNHMYMCTIYEKFSQLWCLCIDIMM